MDPNFLPQTTLGFLCTSVQYAPWSTTKIRPSGWKGGAVCKMCGDGPSDANVNGPEAANGRVSRRAMLKTAGALALLPVVQSWMGVKEAQAGVASTLGASEGLMLLRTMSVRVDDLQAQAAFGNLDDLRRALRLEPFGRLRMAVAAVSAGTRRKNVADAAKHVRTAVESADITALRASRGQTSPDNVPPRLEDLRSAIADLVALVDVGDDEAASGSDSPSLE